MIFSSRSALCAVVLGVIALAIPALVANPAAAAAKKHHHSARYAKGPVVRMVTEKGTILIKLFPKQAPISSANFEKLVRKGFYNGLAFHRVETRVDFRLVQGGDPKGNGSGGPGYTIKGEFKSNGVNNPLRHNAGAVAMARAGDPNSAGSQFYICINPVHQLDDNYAVFGQVISGLEIVNNLEVGDKILRASMVK